MPVRRAPKTHPNFGKSTHDLLLCKKGMDRVWDAFREMQAHGSLARRFCRSRPGGLASVFPFLEPCMFLCLQVARVCVSVCMRYIYICIYVYISLYIDSWFIFCIRARTSTHRHCFLFPSTFLSAPHLGPVCSWLRAFTKTTRSLIYAYNAHEPWP